ncbi:hypothetical protein MPER_10127, partial [Moniliophthora perniciosa FA553]
MIQDLGYTKSKLVALWLGKSKGAPINKPLLVTAIVLYTLCAAHVINDFGRAITAFISYESNPKGATAYFAQLWHWSSILREAIYCVYRLYIVWNFNIKMIVGPIFVLLAATICGIRAVWGFSNLKQGEDTYAADIYTWGVTIFTLTLLLNLVVTTLIAGRLWWYEKRMATTLGQRHSRKYSQAMGIIVESGAIYSACIFIVLITYATKTNGVVV